MLTFQNRSQDEGNSHGIYLYCTIQVSSVKYDGDNVLKQDCPPIHLSADHIKIFEYLASLSARIASRLSGDR